MKSILKKFLCTALAFVLIFAFTAEAFAADDSTGSTRYIILNSSERISLKPGESTQLNACINSFNSDSKRADYLNSGICFASSDSDVAEVDENGNITAKNKGFAVITLSAENVSASDKYCYVLVEDGSEEKIGNITIFCKFSISDFLSEIDLGHSFIVFKSYKDGVEIKDTEGFFEYYEVTPEYYEAVNSYSGTGYDPVTFYYVTNGEDPTDDNLSIREEYADTLAPQAEPGSPLVINTGEIATFGCTTHEGTTKSAIPKVLSGDIKDILEKYGLTSEGISDNTLEAVSNIDDLIFELFYDFSLGYNPINGSGEGGGVSLNEEIHRQAFRYDASKNVTIQIDITQAQFDAMICYFCNDNYFNVAERNCTEVATFVWNLVTVSRPELRIDSRIGFPVKLIAIPPVFQAEMLKKGLIFKNDPSITVTVKHGPFKADAK